MNNEASVSARWCVASLCALILAAGAAAQEVPTILEVDVENYVIYMYDVTDLSKLARSAGPLKSAFPGANFSTNVIIADVTAINGSPAKGVMVMENQNLNLTPTPTPGQAISDVTRSSSVSFRWEFLKPDGSQIGSVYVLGLSGGSPAPGSAVGAISGSGAIVGGAGAFIGAKGTSNSLQISNARSASQAEDPSMRRTHGGGKGRFKLQIWPMFRPEVVVTPTGPAVFHLDGSLVTSDRPAQRGETLVVCAKGLGPTSPGVNPGDPFPSEPLAVVTSPVEVLVDGKASPAINQVGFPGTTDTYRVDFRVPNTIAAGMVPIQVSAAWVKGTAVRIPVR
jgi:uncharacterized protein (TIGR03437 family)